MNIYLVCFGKLYMPSSEGQTFLLCAVFHWGAAPFHGFSCMNVWLCFGKSLLIRKEGRISPS